MERRPPHLNAWERISENATLPLHALAADNGQWTCNPTDDCLAAVSGQPCTSSISPFKGGGCTYCLVNDDDYRAMVE